MTEKSIQLSIVVLGTLAMLFSCRGDLETIDSLTKTEKGPIESAFQVEITYSDHGRVRMILHAPRMDRFVDDEPFLEMPEGIHVIFYDTLMQESSSLQAEYAISHEDSEHIEARRNVVVINELGERLNTEQLIWDQKAARIYSETFVKVTTEEEVLFGDGFESDERFDHWRILNPHGTFQLNTGPGKDSGPHPDASGPASKSPGREDITPGRPEPQVPGADVTEANGPDIHGLQKAPQK